MKRTFIAGVGATILGLTALPFTGVLAVDGATSSITDTLQVIVSENCQMEVEQEGSEVMLGVAALGSAYDTKNGTEMKITCNTQDNWTLKATATDLVNVANSARKIPFGAYSETDDKSMWAAKINIEGNEAEYTMNEAWADFATAKNSEIVASGTTAGTIVVTPQYKAYVSEGQGYGYYEGTISYTFAKNE